MSFRDASENEILDTVFNEGTAITVATHLAIVTNTPGDAGALTEVRSPGVDGYARQAISAAGWNAAASGSKSNSANIEFGAATADWATGGTLIRAVVAMSAGTGGSGVFVFTMTSPLEIASGQTLRFLGGSPGNLAAALD